MMGDRSQLVILEESHIADVTNEFKSLDSEASLMHW